MQRLTNVLAIYAVESTMVQQYLFEFLVKDAIHFLLFKTTAEVCSEVAPLPRKYVQKQQSFKFLLSKAAQKQKEWPDHELPPRLFF